MELQTFQDVSPIFVVGHARSGTTLLQMLLNTHPNIAIYSEVHFFSSILDLKILVPNLNSEQNIDHFFQILETIKTIKYLPNHEEIFNRVKTKLKQDTNANYETFYRYSLEEYSEMECSSRWGDKTTDNIRYLEELLGIFPKAKIIHIVRNPKDVIASKIKVPWSPNSIIINALKWKIDILYGQEFAADYPKSYIEVRYEDLVDYPELEMKRILTFVNEPFNDVVTNFHKKSNKYIRNEPWKEGVNKPVNQNSVGKGDKELSKNQVLLIEKMIGDTWLNHFNYTISTSSTSMIKLFKITLEDILAYISYKYKEKRMRKESEVLYANNEKVKNSWLKALFFSNSNKLIKYYSNSSSQSKDTVLEVK